MIGKDQKIIWRATETSSLLNWVKSPRAKANESAGKTATEYDSPIIVIGTDCRLNEKLKIETEPTERVVAIARIIVIVILESANPRVRGKESKNILFIYGQFIFVTMRGRKPCARMTGS